MATIKVHGIPRSSNTMRVRAALYEKDLKFEQMTVMMRYGAQKQRPYIYLNPYGQVPAFSDGDLMLFESRAITEYIADEYSDKGKNLISSSCKKSKAITKVWIQVESQQFDPIASELTSQRYWLGNYRIATAAAAVEELETKLSKVLDIYEARLEKSDYLAGDSFTLADLHHLPEIHDLMRTDSKELFESRTKVSEWVQKITSRPAWVKVIDRPFC